MKPGRITHARSAKTRSTSRSHATFRGPYVSSVTSSVSGNGGSKMGEASVPPGGRSSACADKEE